LKPKKAATIVIGKCFGTKEAGFFINHSSDKPKKVCSRTERERFEPKKAWTEPARKRFELKSLLLEFQTLNSR